MTEAKDILVVCGTSVATSTVVRERLLEALPDKGISVGDIDKAKATEARGKAGSGKYDLIVTTTSLNEDRFDIPVYHTTAFMTGVGQDEAVDEIVALLS